MDALTPTALNVMESVMQNETKFMRDLPLIGASIKQSINRGTSWAVHRWWYFKWTVHVKSSHYEVNCSCVHDRLREVIGVWRGSNTTCRPYLLQNAIKRSYIAESEKAFAALKAGAVNDSVQLYVKDDAAVDILCDQLADLDIPELLCDWTSGQAKTAGRLLKPMLPKTERSK